MKKKLIRSIQENDGHILFGIFTGIFLVLIIQHATGYEFSNNNGGLVGIFGLKPTIVIIASLLLASTFIVFKYTMPISYGILEFILGLWGIVILVQQYDYNFTQVLADYNILLKLSAGIYFMVRGMDNFLKGLGAKMD